MGSCGSCAFKIGYKLYADTRIGKYMHSSFLHRFKLRYGEGALHSKITQFVFGNLIIIPIPVITNNYTYLVADAEQMNFVLVDVGDISEMMGTDTNPDAILTTHRHWDHSYGNMELHNRYPDMPIYGGKAEHVPGATHSLSDGDVINFGRLKFTAIWTPGHTRGHMCYLLDGAPFDSPDSLFTGDHLMLGGCGANFESIRCIQYRPCGQSRILLEGTSQECSIMMMIQSLQKLTTLSKETLVWPGHEVGLNSLILSVYLEKNNLVAQEKLMWIAARRLTKLCTCPSTLEEEMQYNPFLRTNDNGLLRELGLISPDGYSRHDVGSVEMAVACYKEILNRIRDESEDAMKRRAEILAMVFQEKLATGELELNIRSNSAVRMLRRSKCHSPIGDMPPGHTSRVVPGSTSMRTSKTS